MARHDQKTDRRHMVCKACEVGNCVECIDVLRMVYTNKTICECIRQNHSGEPRDQQILDPESGTVFAPGLKVTIDGTVERNANRHGYLDK
jgi:hypothetical protein